MLIVLDDLRFDIIQFAVDLQCLLTTALGDVADHLRQERNRECFGHLYQVACIRSDEMTIRRDSHLPRILRNKTTFSLAL